MDKIKNIVKNVYTKKKKKDRKEEQPMTASFRRERAAAVDPPRHSSFQPQQGHAEPARHSSLQPQQGHAEPPRHSSYHPPQQPIMDPSTQSFHESDPVAFNIPRRRRPEPSSSAGNWSSADGAQLHSSSFNISGQSSHQEGHVEAQTYAGGSYHAGGSDHAGGSYHAGGSDHAGGSYHDHRVEHAEAQTSAGCSYHDPRTPPDAAAPVDMDIDEEGEEEAAEDTSEDEGLNEDDPDQESATDEEAALAMDPVIPPFWRLTEVPVPGGPLLTSVITSFGGHVAIDLWSMTKDRGVLGFKPRKPIITNWPFSGVTCKRARNMIQYSALEHLLDVTWGFNNMSLISAFVERWQLDTNSFHMPFGEMTITLHDVWQILRIPIVGHPILGSPTNSELKEEMAKLLDFEEGVDQMMKYMWHTGAVQICPLIEWCSTGQRVSMKQACGWLYYALTTTIFANKGHSRMSPLPFWLVTPMGKNTKLKRFAWGAGTLACLYRQLGVASRADCNSIAGSLTLLECWIYAYFPTLRPAVSADWRDGDDRPWAMRWVRPTSQQKDQNSLENYRKHIDVLTARNIDWLPYGRDKVNENRGRSWYRGTLQYMTVNEPYMPERCLRQFGYVQCIPPPPIRPNNRSEKRGRKGKPYRCVYPPMYSVWDTTRECGPTPGLTKTRAALHACDEDYLDWYVKHTHPKIMNPDIYENTFVHRPDPALLLSEASELARPYYQENNAWDWSYYRQRMPEEEQRAATDGLVDVFSSLYIWDSYQRQHGAP